MRSKTKSKINPASLLKNQSNPLKKQKQLKQTYFFFSKNHHMNMIKMTGLKICNTTRRESKREKNVASPNRKFIVT